MRKFKELRDFLKESEYTPTTDTWKSAYSDYGVYRIEDKEQLNKINAFIHNFTEKAFIEPRHAMSQLRHRLNLAGLDFEMPHSNAIEEGTKSYKINRFGGEFGTTPTHNLMTDSFYKSDGISHQNNGVGMTLRCSYTVNESGLYNIKAMIVPDTEGSDEE